MTDDPHSRGGPPTYTQDGAGSPEPAERVRTLVSGQVDGTLSTVALDPAGYPFGSIVTYALDEDGAPLVLMSTMAEHARNLAADPRGSLLVTAGGDGAGRLAAARVTLVGRITPVADDAQPAATERYLAVHPDAFWARFPDFGMHRLQVEAIRYVRGFGEMGWVSPEAYAAAEADPIDAAAELRIVTHVNEDHADALADIVAAFLPVAGEVDAVTMTSCDRYGFEVRIDLVAGEDERPGLAFGRLGFDEVLTEPGQARHAMVRLVRAAEAALAG